MIKGNNCTACPYKNKRLVPPTGNPHAPVMILGEAPGANEEADGVPFVGGAGKILSIVLSKGSLSRGDCYITNVLKCRPDGNNIESSDAITAIDCCLPYLIDELKQTTRNVIVPLGNTALRALGIIDKIGTIRGYLYRHPSWGLILPTWHPAYLMHQPQEYVTSTYDFRKIAHYAHGHIPEDQPERFILNPTIEQVYAFCNRILEATQFRTQDIGLDIETLVGHPYIIPLKLAGIAWRTQEDNIEVLEIPFITQSGNLYWQTREEAKMAISLLGSLLESTRVRKVIHNSLFDLYVLMASGFAVNPPIYDTMIAHILIYFPAAHTLNYLVSIYLDYFSWKNQVDNLSDTSFRTYNSRDAAVLLMLLSPLNLDMVDNGVTGVFISRMNIIIPILKMLLRGITVDSNIQMSIAAKLEAAFDISIASLQKITRIPGFNPRSTTQLAAYLFDTLKLKSSKSTKGGSRSTDESVINRFALTYSDHPFFQELLRFKGINQLLTNFAIPPIQADSKVHAIFKLNLVTGRGAISKPPLHNIPTIGKEDDPLAEFGWIKSMYVPAPGHVFIKGDFSQAELIGFAVIANDTIWLDMHHKGIDIHAANGDIILPGGYNPRYRRFLKNFVFGLIYGSKGAAVKAVVPLELIKQVSVETMIQKLFRAHPALPRYFEARKQDVMVHHQVVNPFGLVRYFPGTPTEENIREGINFPVQSTVGEIAHRKVTAVDAAIDPAYEGIVLYKHDEIVLEVPEHRAEQAATLLKQIMEEPITAPNGMVFDLKVEIEIGTSLADYMHPNMFFERTHR